jgi:hypothetical protein
MSDSTNWPALEAELDTWQPGSLRLWLRDDDAVAPSPALDRLARLGEDHALPVLLAVIPMLAQPALAPALAAMPALRPCQHGCWHRNHAPAGGKKSEFGAERDGEEVASEIALARQRLDDLLGPSVLPVFVPPWNRIDRSHAARLPELGFAGLSCFRNFTLGPEGGPTLVNTDLDVMDWQGGRVGRGLPSLVDEICALLVKRRAGGALSSGLGILLHHRDHDETVWDALAVLLPRLLAHRAVLATGADLQFLTSHAAQGSLSTPAT